MIAQLAPSVAAPRTDAPAVARDRQELDALLGTAQATHGPRPTVRAVVMTMGALHDGHATLLRAARERCDQLVATIFVNPLQFGPGEDLDRYPRTLDADLELCARENVDVVFAPAAVHETPPLIRVSAGSLGDILEGASRPGHFDGVLTIVASLLHLVRPDLAFFGQKDAQQLALIRRMVADLAFPTTIVGVPTVRDGDGLARSSRNAYLSAAERRAALALPRALDAGDDVAQRGGGRADILLAGRSVLDAEPGVVLDYLELADPTTLGPAQAGEALLLVAARVGATRLIDNRFVTLGSALASAPADARQR
ncbi:MAG: pantoate--beta-alanine ligase [Frankia sp.]